jgi:hypothetical protein
MNLVRCTATIPIYNIHCSISYCNKSINNCICCTRTTSISVGPRLRRRIDCSEDQSGEYLYKGDMYQHSRESSRWIWIWPLNLIQKDLSYFFEIYSNTYDSSISFSNVSQRLRFSKLYCFYRILLLQEKTPKITYTDELDKMSKQFQDKLPDFIILTYLEFTIIIMNSEHSNTR